MFNKTHGEINPIALIITMVVSYTSLITGLVVVATIEKSMPSITSSTLSSSLSRVMNYIGGSFTYLALGSFLMATLFVITMVSTKP